MGSGKHPNRKWRLASSFLDTCGMDTTEEFQQRWLREQRLHQRLRLAAFRLEAAQVERAWAVLSAYRQGLSIREIAAPVGLSRARVPQLLSEEAAAEVPAQLNRLREQGWLTADDGDGHGAAEDLVLARLSDEV